jgi:parvulin-like peptidyl-prolyl isomerase
MRPWVVMAAGLLAAAWGGGGAAAEAPPGSEPEASSVLARVNNVEITYGDLKGRLLTLEQQGPVPPERRGEILRGLVREEVLVQGALADKLDQDAGVKGRLELARRQVLVEELLKRKVLSRIQVSEDEARKMYEDSKSLLTTEAVEVSHIMLKTQEEAEAVRQELVGGKDFAEVARARSQDTGSAEKGGHLGTLNRGQTVAEFEEAAFRLKEGELSPVVKTQYGYHIIKGGAHRDVTQPYEEVQERIRQLLVQQKQRDAFQAYLAELEKALKPEVFEDRLR